MSGSTKKAGERGVSMIIVVLIVALGLTAALVLAGMVNVDLDVVGTFRRANEVRDLSSSGAGDLVVGLGADDSNDVLNKAAAGDKDLRTWALSAEQRAALNARMGQAEGTQLRYRILPLRLSEGGCSGAVGAESGYGRVQGLWYEARVEGRAQDAADEVRVEFCRPISKGGVTITAGR